MVLRLPRPTLFPYTTLFRSYTTPSTTAGEALTASPVVKSQAGARRVTTGDAVSASRSEEHTSELQSHVNLVCRLLLEKKKAYCNHKSTYFARYLTGGNCEPD